MTTIALAPVNIVHIIFLSVCGFGLLLTWGKKQHKALALLLVTYSIQQLFNILEELNITRQYHLITPAIQMAYGPLYYLFCKNLVYGNIQLCRHLIHLLPALIAIAFTAWWPIVLQVAFAWLIIYFALTFHLLRRYHKVLPEIIADTDRHTLDWLTRVLIIIFVIEFIDFTRLNLQLHLDYNLLVNWYFVSALITLSYVTYILLKVVRQPSLYMDIAKFEQQVLLKTTGEVTQAQAVFGLVDQHVRTSLAYRKPKYGLRDLADELGITEANISWAINQGGGQSFSSYINSFRVDEVKEAIASGLGRQNLLDIAFKAGFNSKSSFNAVFKRHAGMSPSEYMHQQLVLKSRH